MDGRSNSYIGIRALVSFVGFASLCYLTWPCLGRRGQRIGTLPGAPQKRVRRRPSRPFSRGGFSLGNPFGPMRPPVKSPASALQRGNATQGGGDAPLRRPVEHARAHAPPPRSLTSRDGPETREGESLLVTLVVSCTARDPSFGLGDVEVRAPQKKRKLCNESTAAGLTHREVRRDELPASFSKP